MGDPAPDPDPMAADWAPGFPAATHFGSEDVYMNDPGEWVSFVSADTEAHFALIEKRQHLQLPRERIEGFEPAVVEATDLLDAVSAATPAPSPARPRVPARP